MIALRCQCKECGAALTVKLGPVAGDTLAKCPQCRKGWAAVENHSYREEIANFESAALALKNVLPLMGFALTLEIKPQT